MLINKTKIQLDKITGVPYKFSYSLPIRSSTLDDLIFCMYSDEVLEKGFPLTIELVNKRVVFKRPKDLFIADRFFRKSKELKYRLSLSNSLTGIMYIKETKNKYNISFEEDVIN